MRKEMIKAETEQEARDAAPWACEIADEGNTLDESPCGAPIGWWRDPSLPSGAVGVRERTDITCSDAMCAICAPHRAQEARDDRQTIGDLAEAWAGDKTDAALWRDGAARILRAVRSLTSDDGGILDAAYDALAAAGYTEEEIDDGDLCEELAEAFLGRLIEDRDAAPDACALGEACARAALQAGCEIEEIDDFMEGDASYIREEMGREPTREEWAEARDGWDSVVDEVAE